MPRGPLVTGVLAFALAITGLTSCGSDDEEAGPSKAATDCRDKWRRLGEDVAPLVEQTQPSALPRRWNTVAATIDYYRVGATGDDCGARLDAQQKGIAALKEFSATLVVFDMEAQLDELRDDAEAYAAGPWPPAPTPSPSPSASPGAKKNKKKQPKPERPPKPALVGAALKTLTAQAPVAAEQQNDGWGQASTIDLDDTAAKGKAVKDLRFLSTESTGWRACQPALATIRKALAAADQ